MFLHHFKVKYAELLASVRGKRHEAKGDDVPIDRMQDETLMAVLDRECHGFSVFTHALQAIGCDQGFGKPTSRLDQRIRAGHVLIVAVKVAVKDQAHLLDVRGRIEAVFEHVALVSYPEVILTAISAVANDLAATKCLLGQFGLCARMPRQVAVVLHQSLLKCGNINVLDRHAISYGHRDGRAECLT